MSALAAPLPVRLARLVRLEHTVFALPFAYVGALLSVDGWPGIGPMAWVTVAMVGARTLAISCRDVFARGGRTVDVRGPLIEEEALVVHEGFWR